MPQDSPRDIFVRSARLGFMFELFEKGGMPGRRRCYCRSGGSTGHKRK